MKNYYTIPNLITLFRFLLIPFILYFILFDRIYVAVALFIVSTLTDKLDGYLARRLKQATYEGGYFDAATDSILIFGTIIFMNIKGNISLILLTIVLLPKIITYALTHLVHKGKYSPTTFSRLSSVALFIIIPVILLGLHPYLVYSLVGGLYFVAIVHWSKVLLKI